jgi:lipopolysaccharide transport system permease protein
MDQAITVYDAESRSGSVWREMVGSVFDSRELIWRLFIRDLSAKYEQSILGYVWAVAPPLTTVAIFTLLSRNRVLSIGETSLPYPAFVFLGLTVWGLFSTGLGSITGSLTAAASVIKKMNFPREALVLSALGQALFDTAIRTVFLVLFFIWYDVSVSWSVLLLPIVLIPLLLITLGAGFLFATLNALVRDVGNALGIAIQFAMFLTPVVYPAPKTWPLSLMNYLNPVSAFVIAAQDLVVFGSLSNPQALVSSSLFGVALFIIGWRVFRLAQPIIGERI